MENDDRSWFDDLSEEDKAVVRDMHRLHANANVRTQLVAMLLLVIPIRAMRMHLQRVNQRLRLRFSDYWLLERDGKILVRYLSPVACPTCGMAETLAEVLTVEEALRFLQDREILV
ncbi:hypothetical protein [Acidithiobacillus ferrooxidans]|uniref:hypothetical protein n=1 Tax=Acidithiobacillus ferrooxidans TaxID=920 RepID=UPI000AA452A8|nr:hypothetical protein [Acidithiobacillus ferrooxidans]